MRVRIAKERSDLTYLVSVAIKTTFHTRSPGGVERCIDVLNQLKSLSLSVEDLRLSESVFKLETLTRHRNPKIRKETQALFHSWSMKRDDERYQTKREEKTCFLELNKKEYQKNLTREVVVKIEKETKTDACNSVTTKQPFKVAEISSVTATALHQHPKRNIIDKDCKVTAKNKNIPRRPVSMTNQQQNEPAKDSGNPNKSAALKTKTEEKLKKRKAEIVELFEAANKAADAANSNGIFSGKTEVSRCVEALSLLMKINITPKPREPRRMMERLEGLTKHKYHKICNAASALLQLWRQRIREQERRHQDVF